MDNLINEDLLSQAKKYLLLSCGWKEGEEIYPETELFINSALNMATASGRDPLEFAKEIYISSDKQRKFFATFPDEDMARMMHGLLESLYGASFNLDDDYKKLILKCIGYIKRFIDINYEIDKYLDDSNLIQY